MAGPRNGGLSKETLETVCQSVCEPPGFLQCYNPYWSQLVFDGIGEDLDRSVSVSEVYILPFCTLLKEVG